MNFNYINSVLILVVCLLIYSCQTIQNFKNEKNSEFNESVNKEDYENSFKFDFNYSSLNSEDNLDYYSNNFIGKFNLENKIKNKIKIDNYKNKYNGQNNIKVYIVNDFIYGVDSKSNFNKYNLENGKLVDSINLQKQYDYINLIPTSLSLYNENFIIGFKSGLILMIDKNGKLIWKLDYNDILSTPIKIHNENIIIIFSDSIRSIAIDSGEENWSAKYDGEKIIQSKGGLSAEFANFIYFLLPNFTFGEFDTLIRQKNVSNFNNINFKTSLYHSSQGLHLYKNFLSYYNGSNKLSTYDIFNDKIILNDFIVANSSFYNFHNNSLIVQKNKKIIAYNIINGKIFWVISLEDVINKKNNIINIQNFNDILYVFLNNGKIILIKNNIIYDVIDLKIKNISLIYFQNNKFFASLDNGKTIVY